LTLRKEEDLVDQTKLDRRGFLGTMGAAAAGLGLATQVAAQTQGANAAPPGSGSNPDVVTRALPRTGERLSASAPS
jgi:hypothetical protein